MKRVFCILGIVAIWLALVGGMYAIYSGGYHEKRAQIPVKTEIEQAIEVKGLENKFVFARHILLGGAGGGGLGAPMVICSSVQQFIDLVPEEEPIFVAFEFPVVKESEGENTSYSIKKVYWAFIENRAGIMVYENEYSYADSYGDYWVEKYTPEMVYFSYDNGGEILFSLVMVGIFGLVIAAVFTSILALNIKP